MTRRVAARLQGIKSTFIAAVTNFTTVAILYNWMEPSSSGELSKKRDYYRAQIATALEEDPDPLAAYDGFVKWILESYAREQLAQSGLLELLEEATRKFKDDAAYKGDLRYLKLWLLYASHVEDPSLVYAFLLENNIGAVYAQMYWEYAAALEQSRR